MTLRLAEYGALERANLAALLRSQRSHWKTLYDNAYSYAKVYVGKSPLREADVVDGLIPALEVTTLLTDELAKKKLRQKYWYRLFANLIVDYFWHKRKP